jgi:hypothetical protein
MNRDFGKSGPRIFSSDDRAEAAFFAGDSHQKKCAKGQQKSSFENTLK